MRTNRFGAGLLGLIAAAGVMMAPISSVAQGSLEEQSKRRQEKKNEWRNIAIGSGAVGLLGLLKHDNTLTFAGAGGALYSLNRYEQDRKSQSKIDHARAAYFSKPYFYRDGKRYVRKSVTRNGKKYYRFVRAD